VEGCPIVSAGTGIPRHALLACEPLGRGLSAQSAAEAVAGGLIAAGQPAPDVCLLGGEHGDEASVLAREGFDARMRAARAVVLVLAGLREETLSGSAAFEIATRARQGGVPCYAIVALNRLDAFDQRILDLQAVLQADTPRALSAAGRRLAKLL
jgi:glycerate 2-kinase